MWFSGENETAFTNGVKACTGNAGFSFADTGLSAATSGWLSFHIQGCYLDNLV